MSLLLSQKCYVSKVDNATVSSDADKAECLNSYFASIFTARQHSLLSAVLAIVNLSDRLSDRLSVTCWYQAKTTQATIHWRIAP